MVKQRKTVPCGNGFVKKRTANNPTETCPVDDPGAVFLSYSVTTDDLLQAGILTCGSPPEKAGDRRTGICTVRTKKGPRNLHILQRSFTPSGTFLRLPGTSIRASGIMQKTGQNMLTIHADAACSRHLLMVHTHNTHLPIHADSTDCCRTRPFTVAGQYGISTRFPFHLRRQTASAPAETIYSSSRRTRGRVLHLHRAGPADGS